MSALENWSEEKRSAFLYSTIAAYETDPLHQKLFHDLAKAANKQAEIWENVLKKSGEKIPGKYIPDFRTRLVAWLAQHLGTKPLRFILSAMKVRGMSIYSGAQPDEKIISTIPSHENRHKSVTSAGNLRAAVFGVNDGLISNVSLILGVAGANADHRYILLTGIAGLLAGACSMAAGEYISVQSQREFFEYQINLEKSELEEYPEEEAHELAIIYQARGLPQLDAEKLAQLMISDPEKALNTLAREELGLNPNDLGSAVGASISSFLSFATGAFIPMIPFLFGKYSWNLLASILLTGLALLAIGATLSLFTSRSALKSGLRMLLIGCIAGSLTYGLGHLIGVSV